VELWLCYLPIQVPLVQVDDLSLAVGHRKLGTAVLFISVLERPLPVAEVQFQLLLVVARAASAAG
jgi:hypothetical protein